MTTLYLIRHGDIPKHSPRRFLGQGDPALTERGRKRVASLAEGLSGEHIEKIYCSPLSRCRESAEIICSYIGLKPTVNDNLAEINLGLWEGLTVEEVKQRFPGEYERRGRDLSGFRPDGGESFADLLGRAWPLVKRIRADQYEKVAIVTHAGVNRVLLCRILGMPLQNMFRIEQDYCCMNVVQAKNGFFQVAKMNL